MQVLAVARSDLTKGKCAFCQLEFTMKRNGTGRSINYRIFSAMVEETNDPIPYNLIVRGEACTLPDKFITYVMELFVNVRRLRKRVNRGKEIYHLHVCDCCETEIFGKNLYNLVVEDIVEGTISIDNETQRGEPWRPYIEAYRCTRQKEIKSAKI